MTQPNEPTGIVKPFARGRACSRHEPGEMNGLERAYAEILQARLLVGEIAAWVFESVKLRLADRTFYTPDFMVIHNDGMIEFIEVKGFWEDDARVKFKVVAELFPWFKFSALRRIKGEWMEAA